MIFTRNRNARASVPASRSRRTLAAWVLSPLLVVLAAIAALGTRGVAQSTPPTSVHVDSMHFYLDYERHGGFRGTHVTYQFHGAVLVRIVDDQGQPVSGAEVRGVFSGTERTERASAVTNADGVAWITSAPWFVVQPSDPLPPLDMQFCVTDVSASLPYDPASNAVTCARIVVQ